jgi:hypothetical protein
MDEQLDLNSMLTQMNQAMADPGAFAPPKNSDYEKDTRFYTVSKKKDGSASVKIRFIPSLNAEKTRMQTFVTQQVHAPEVYKEEKKRFIKEVCPKTVHGKDAKCPICDHCWDNYMPLKEAGLKDSKEAKALLKFASKDHFITNILILEDTEQPENNGKVFLFEFKGQLQELIKKQMQPSTEEQSEKGMKPFNAWDLTGGKDFRLKLTPGSATSNGFPSWTDSFFSNDTSGIVTTEPQMKELLGMTHCLDEFISVDKISSEEKLQAQLDYVTWKPKHGAKSEAEDTTPKKAKEEELSSIPGMILTADVKKDDLGSLPEWATSVTTPTTPPSPTDSVVAQDNTPPFDVNTTVSTVPATTTETPKAPQTAEEFMASLNFK